MNTQALKPYIKSPPNVKELKKYFSQYNAQLDEIDFGDVRINVSQGLIGIINSIDEGFANNPYKGRTGYWDYYMWAHDAQKNFCESVLTFFGKNKKVPGFNVQDMIESSEKSKTVEAIVESFPKFTQELNQSSKQNKKRD
ncbi:MAG: hypothetical protein KKC19_00545 [Nanoarchaeota archaeon]|nr:hypothetical protein [Nanoarchaeota archaeon]